ncbi:hypothetical protein [Nonomuraea sediminis]|uniref:hypothetical protein n=1 Tax=Nonomuraea sediminis TaxID=2835864 RepID=UPI001BDD07FF|nr:hypothetical protein [Nonomuraea sediminis]
MNEHETLDALRAANPAPRPSLSEERQAAITEGILSTPARGARRRAWVLAAAAAALVAVIAVGAVVGSWRDPRPAAAEVMENAARAVTSAETTYQRIPDERQAYQRTTETTAYDAGGYRYTVERTVETWVSPDGVARVKTTMGAPRFDDQGQERAWREKGGPRLPGVSVPGATEGPAVYQVGDTQLDYQAMLALPRDPGLLQARLGRDRFDAARRLLVAPALPGDLRAALYRVIAAQPGITVTERTPGRVTVTRGDEELSVDPRTGAVLSSGTTVVRQAGLVNCVSTVERPASIVLTCADANYVLERLTWSAWGGPTARAAGVARVNTCDPDCADGRFVSYPVEVTLDGQRFCGQNLTLYTRARVHYLDRVPRGLRRTDVTDLPCGP